MIKQVRVTYRIPKGQGGDKQKLSMRTSSEQAQSLIKKLIAQGCIDIKISKNRKGDQS